MADGWGLVRKWVVEKHFILGWVGTWAFKAMHRLVTVLAISNFICVRIGVLSFNTLIRFFFFLSTVELASWFLQALSFGDAGGGVIWALYPFPRALSPSKGISLKLQGLSMVRWGLLHWGSRNIGTKRGDFHDWKRSLPFKVAFWLQCF